MDATTKSEIIRKATTAGLMRSNHVEAERLIDWLLANGFQYVGPGLEQERQRIKPRAYDANGTPIYDRGADFSPTRTIEMGRD
jgi:hypothetical protein